MGRGGKCDCERAQYKPSLSSTRIRSSVPTPARDSLVSPSATAATVPGPRAPPQPLLQGRPPHPQLPAAVGSGAVGGITSAGSRTLSTTRGRLVPGEARRSLSPASVYRKCAAPPSLLLQYHWPTSGDRGRLQIPTNPNLGLLIPSMQRRL